MLAALAQTSPVLLEQVLAFAFADVYDRPHLDRNQRQLVIVAVLTTLGAEPELKVHIGAALRAGLTPEQVTEAILQTVPYSGFPAPSTRCSRQPPSSRRRRTPIRHRPVPPCADPCSPTIAIGKGSTVA